MFSASLDLSLAAYLLYLTAYLSDTAASVLFLAADIISLSWRIVATPIPLARLSAESKLDLQRHTLTNIAKEEKKQERLSASIEFATNQRKEEEGGEKGKDEAAEAEKDKSTSNEHKAEHTRHGKEEEKSEVKKENSKPPSEEEKKREEEAEAQLPQPQTFNMNNYFSIGARR